MNLMDYPIVIFGLCFLIMLVSVWIGDYVRRRKAAVIEDRDDHKTVLGATLTLLGLIIGFSFSMAISRYDLRKNYEEAEANAIGTEYVRADLAAPDSAAKIRAGLKKYVEARLLFYNTRDPDRLAKINADTAALQNELWAAARPKSAQPNPVDALVVSGMNDVLNSQGYTQAAWWNRIPIEAWLLMGAIGIVSNLLIGYGAQQTKWSVFLVVPIAVSIAFFLIADIDSPVAGAIRVVPQNLVSLSRSLSSQ